jgi:hypothetical protein
MDRKTTNPTCWRPDYFANLIMRSPLDDLSMQALQDYIASVPEDALPPLEHVDIYGPEQHDSATPRRLPFQQQSTGMMSPLTATPRLPPRRSKPEDLMMEQLKLQTSLILDMQRKLIKLSHRIEELEDSGGSVRLRRSSIPPVPPVAAPGSTAFDGTAGGQGPQEEAQPLPGGAIPLRPRGVPPESRLARLLLLFGRLRGREVQNMEWGLIFKVVVMMTILFSRLGAANLKQIPAKFYLLGAMLVGGFLFQTGYLQFLYRFVVKENYPYRILVLDEVIPDESPVPPRPRPPGLPHQDDEAWIDLRHTFLAGRIERAPEEDANQVPVVFRFFREALLLLLSFVLSVLPFWHPEAPPPPPAAGGDGPGDVQPPVDPAGPADDDEDIDDDDDSADDGAR